MRVLHMALNMRKSVAIFQTVATKNKEQEAQLHVHHMICTPLKWPNYQNMCFKNNASIDIAKQYICILNILCKFIQSSSGPNLHNMLEQNA